MNEEAIEEQVNDVFHFSSRTQRLSETVIQAVAWVEGVEPIDLDPLAEFIDPAALDMIFAETEDGMLEFEMRGLTIRVHSNGDIELVRRSVEDLNNHRNETQYFEAQYSRGIT